MHWSLEFARCHRRKLSRSAEVTFSLRAVDAPEARERYFKRYTTVVSVSAGSGVSAAGEFSLAIKYRTMRVMQSAGLAVLLGAATAAFAQPNLPYKSIDDPEFIPASAATFLNPGDRLIGIASGRAVKAYPAAILAQHGVVLDQLPDGPIAVTW